jgi:hypothetical protein
MVGLANWMEKSDLEKALIAVCGLSAIYDQKVGQNDCNLAGLYQAIKSGSLQAVLSQLGNLIGDIPLGKMLQAAGAMSALQTAIQTGDMQNVLTAAATLANLAGEGDVAKYLAGAASIVYTLENGGDIMDIMSNFFAVIGEQNMANFFSSLKSLEAAVESGDARTILRSAGALAQSLGYSGLAQFESALTQGENLVNMIANFDQVLEYCKGKVPWDLICVVPMVSGGVCEEKWGACALSYGLPTFDVSLLCNDLVFNMGFQIDCTCVYACPDVPIPVPLAKSVRMNLNEILMSLIPSQYAGLFQALGLAQALATGDFSAFCRFDP